MLRGGEHVTQRRRAGTPLLVVHSAVGTDPGRPARVGLVVSRAVGNSVVRHRVSRRLRHLAADRLPLVGESTDLVLRATPAAATASSAELGAALDSALTRINKPNRADRNRPRDTREQANVDRADRAGAHP